MPSRRHRDVLLDIDGTLVDSNDAHARAWLTAFAERGFEVAFAHVRRLIGMGGDGLIPAAIGLEEDDPRIEGLGARRTRIFLDRELPALRPTPGARALLERLRGDGARLAVATSAKSEELSALLAVAGIEDLVTATTTADDAGRTKPDPDIVKTALARLDAAAADAVLLGDTPYDVIAATRAGVDVIAVRCGGWGDGDLAGAIAVYDHPADLLAQLERSPLASPR